MVPSIHDISQFSEQIAERFAPEKIILFGSHAYGSPTPDSDVDMLIVMDDVGNPREKAIEIRSAFRRQFPLDLIVRSSSELQRRIAMDDYFLKEITERGKVLYERAN